MKLNKKIRILVVEDETEARDYVCDVLSKNGYDVLDALDSEEAFERFDSFKPDVVIMDIKLDGSKYNGVQVAEILLKKSSFILMYYTANAPEYRKEVKITPHAWIFKGTKREEILIQAEDCIQKHRSILRGYENDKMTYNVKLGDNKHPIDVSKLVFIESQNVSKGKSTNTITKFYVAGELEKDYSKSLNPGDFIKEMEDKGYMNMVRVHSSFAVNRAFVDDFDFADNIIYYQIKDKDGRRGGVREIKTSDTFKDNIENLKKYRSCKE